MNDVLAFPMTAPPANEDEKARRLATEVDRLSGQPLVEWRCACKHRAAQFGVTPDELRELVEAKLKEVEKAKTKEEVEQRRHEQRAERKRERERRNIEKEAERKAKDRSKAFTEIARLPCDRTEAELSRLATRLGGEDLTALRDEFAAVCTIDIPSTPATWDVEREMDTRRLQHFLVHASITNTVHYTAMSPEPFKDIWRK